MSIQVTKIGNRNICIKGVGKLFYQNGFPISMSVSELEKKNIEVSMFHVADECLKHGWSPKTTLTKLKDDFKDSCTIQKYDFNVLEEFCYAPYEEQRELIFNYLFGNKENAIEWANEILK
jgi:hypothetical protein